ncbi:MAG: TatD family hydrolase [bacterium]
MPKYIDTHAHVNFSAYKDDAGEVIKLALDNETWVVNVGSQSTTSKRALEMAHEYDEWVYAVVGIHPLHLDKSHHDEEELGPSGPSAGGGGFTSAGETYDHDFYLPLAQDSKTLAIGEVGLDYHHFNEGDDIEALKTKQKETLIEFIKLANEVEKPLMVHCWDAYDDLLNILTAYPVTRKGIIHSFVGGFRTAKKFIELGYYIGMNGVVTYSPDFNRLIKEVPLEWIVSETDCPYLAPGAHKGERNEPLLVKEVVSHIAKVKELPEEEVREAVLINGKQILGLK